VIKEQVMTSSSVSVAARATAGDPPRLLFTVEEAARVLGIGRTRMFELIQVGSVETVLIGRLRRIPLDALDAFVTGLRESPQGAPRRPSDSQG
jgi:excisionase family DNA binding protein